VTHDPRITTIVVGKGEHQIDGTYLKLKINSAMNIVGDPGVPKSEIVVVGGIEFEKGIPGNSHLQHLTLRQAKRNGVFGESSFTMEDVLVEQCGWNGVWAYGTGGVGQCTNVEVRQCGASGVLVEDGASITLIGAKTTVHHNCTKGISIHYGLTVVYGSSSSTIQLVSPLTKEQVSHDNGGGGNWETEEGGDTNQIKTITKAEFTAVLEQEAAIASRIDALSESIKATTSTSLTVNVPEDSNLNEFVKAVHLVNTEKNFTADRTITIVVGKGEHQIDGNSLEIFSAMNIVGDPGVPKSEIVVMGGIQFNLGIPGNSHLQHLTLRQAKGNGVFGESSFTMEDVLVEQCGFRGVYAYGTGIVGRCTNVEVRQCGCSGVVVDDGASITLIGAKTTVHHNCTDGDSDEYGLFVLDSNSSTIQLVSPLTKEKVSHDNGGGGNWGVDEDADINQIKTITKAEFTAVLEHKAAIESRIDALSKSTKVTLTVNVPEDSNLNEFVKAVHLVNTEKNFTGEITITIVVGKGEHQIDGGYLEIFSAMNIVGDPGVPKSEIVVVGGISFEKEIPGNCHLQHLTLRQAEGHGVDGSSSFTMEDVLVEQCGGHGVFAFGSGAVGRCTNVEVRQCGGSGVVAWYGASVTFIGAKTTVHHNCTKGDSDYSGTDQAFRVMEGEVLMQTQYYGLQVYGASSTIHLVSPLTKEQVSLDNGGGGNWGASLSADINQIKTISQ
jgi:hypothetical protein